MLFFHMWKEINVMLCYVMLSMTIPLTYHFYSPCVLRYRSIDPVAHSDDLWLLPCGLDIAKIPVCMLHKLVMVHSDSSEYHALWGVVIVQIVEESFLTY